MSPAKFPKTKQRGTQTCNWDEECCTKCLACNATVLTVRSRKKIRKAMAQLNTTSRYLGGHGMDAIPDLNIRIENNPLPDGQTRANLNHDRHFWYNLCQTGLE